jgi:hypothetical protein
MFASNNMKKSFTFLPIFFLFLASRQSAESESFRVHQLIPVQLQTDMTPAKINAGINDAVCITLPRDMTFVRGIELDVKIPRDIAEWRDTIAYSLYDNIKPVPTEKDIDYTGDRISVATFPGRLSLTISIPLREDSGIKDSPYMVKIPVIPNMSGRFVFFRLQLVMKGIPETLESSLFEITVKPIVNNEGRLRLAVTEPLPDVTHPYSVYLDDMLFTPLTAGNIVPAGEHHLSVVSDFYRNEVRSFRVDQAKTTRLDITLRDIAPLVRITAPENTLVFFDGTAMEQIKESFVTAPGEHTIKFVIGDYEVVKTINAQNGRSYTVSLSIDASVTEGD